MDQTSHTDEHHLTRKWQHDGPKRLLALDGGGIRGIVSLAFLKRIEALLRKKYSDPEYRLCDHFDLIGGTSTGAIIAAALATGREVAWIQDKYRALAEDVFVKKHDGVLSWLRQGLPGVIAPKFRSESLAAYLEEFFGVPLGSEAVQTGLMIMLRRADTASPWPIHNLPNGKYYDGPAPESGEQWIANKDLSVDRLVLASAAAPTYFEPQEILVGSLPNGLDDIGLFVDGGVSPHNNPALQLFRLATIGAYGVGWPVGADNIELVSVGTGSSKVYGQRRVSEARFAMECLQGLMGDCADEVEMMLQWMSDSPTARRIDGEIGTLDGALLAGDPLLRYLRYNVQLENGWLRTMCGRDFTSDDVQRLRQMDRPENLDLLGEVGALAAEKLVSGDEL